MLTFLAKKYQLKLTDLDGKEPIFTKQVKGHLASNGIMHKKLLKLI